MSRIQVCALVLLLSCAPLAAPSPASAELCAIDAVPAATLLLPYFEVNLNTYRKKKDIITQFSITNTNAGPTVAHVVLWTNLSVPTLAFDVYLSGFDTQILTLNEIFQGNLPPIPPGGEDDDLCPVAGLGTSDLQAAHTGKSVPGFDGDCAATRSGVKARGYLTIDNSDGISDSCPAFPSDSGYFENGGTGYVNNNNILIGEWYVVSKKFLQATPLVAVEAGDTPEVTTRGNFTFYSRYVGNDASDNREPLGRTWGPKYFDEPPANAYFIVWRDSGVEQGPFACSSLGDSGWYPLSEIQVLAFDQAEDATELTAEHFPAETQEVRVGQGFDTPYSSGWAFLNLSLEDVALQSWVGVRQDLKKRRSLMPANLLSHIEGSTPPSSQEPIE